MECSSLRDITILSNDDDNRTLVLTDLGPQGVIRVPAPKRCWPSPTHAQERLRRHSQGCFGEHSSCHVAFIDASPQSINMLCVRH
ncbi:hypothetical protein PC113_g368 [Phytophthora cactorum]|uniref:Uncharacterized protein n=1 Tax=Phytophthora cactorum TaxID=29920 RepID=A0A8T1A2U7_9STRA|nr:hypothetical protein PC113_g368 [Phytophthora cactorum]KAG2887606.1 hypothetical protein PC114_g18764 [Phytophthora cactorum]